MFCLQFSKEYLNYFFGGQGGVESLDPSPLIYALVYSAQKNNIMLQLFVNCDAQKSCLL